MCGSGQILCGAHTTREIKTIYLYRQILSFLHSSLSILQACNRVSKMRLLHSPTAAGVKMPHKMVASVHLKKPVCIVSNRALLHLTRVAMVRRILFPEIF